MLDAGCLDSLVPPWAKKRSPQSDIWAVDYARGVIKIMQRRYPKIHYRVDDVCHLTFPSNYFNYVVAGELIEHLSDPKKFIAEAYRVLKPGGCLAISTPLEEIKERGAVDEEMHVWSFKEFDMLILLESFKKRELKILRSRYFPRYRYSWPTIIAFAWK